MSKVKKFMLRCLISFVILMLIIVILVLILKIKHKDNAAKNSWSWQQEDNVINSMLMDKYPNEGDSNFPVIMMKNQDISKKEDNEKRILVIGDSFTYGYSGTNVNYTWWKQLNLQIKKSGYSNVNVYATGRFYTNTKDELEKVLKNEELMKKIDPDLIIIGYVYNDPEERDEYGLNIIRDVWQPEFPGSFINRIFPELYKEIQDYTDRLPSDYNKLKKFGDLIGAYRFDLRSLMIAEGENLEKYKEVLKDVDNRVKELNIPYFYYFTNNISNNKFVDQAHDNVYNAMKELKINAYYVPYNFEEIMPDIENNYEYSQYINPFDSHPGIMWTYDCGKKVFNILKNDYRFIFEDAKIQDVDELDLNINDTMPFLEVNKLENNLFEFEYPKKGNLRNSSSKFLYYPIEKNYVKLNLEYPKKVSKVKITGESIKNVEVYVNTINQEYGYDLDESRQFLTHCKKIGDGIYEVGYEITSLNISVEFIDESNRNIKFEFVEE